MTARHGYFPKLGSKRIACVSGNNWAALLAALAHLDQRKSHRWKLTPKRLTYFSATARISSLCRQTKPGQTFLGAAARRGGYSNKSSGSEPKTPFPVLSRPSPSYVASTTRATIFGAMPAGRREEHIGWQRQPLLQLQHRRNSRAFIHAGMKPTHARAENHDVLSRGSAEG
jgi:hypothetical protein